MNHNITFGMPVLLECPKIEDNARLCRELGLSFVECNMNLPQYQPRAIDINQFQKIKENYGIYFTLHLDENLDICDFNPLVARAYLDTVLESINLAKKLDIPLLNMHLVQGVYFTLPEKKVYLYDTYRDTYLEKIRQFCQLAEEASKGTNIKICIENAGGYKPYHLAALDLLLESNLFCLTWDVGMTMAPEGMMAGLFLHIPTDLPICICMMPQGRATILSLARVRLTLPKSCVLRKNMAAAVCWRRKRYRD